MIEHFDFPKAFYPLKAKHQTLTKHVIWEQRATKYLPVMWRPHFNKLHLTKDLVC